MSRTFCILFENFSLIMNEVNKLINFTMTLLLFFKRTIWKGLKENMKLSYS